MLLFGVYIHLLVTMAVNDTHILNFTCLNDENHSQWVVHMEADIVSCSVAMVMTNVFQKIKINLLRKLVKIMSDLCVIEISK